MNYDEARQLGPESEAPGKWNWTTMNDRVIRTAPPCAWPDFDDWPSDPMAKTEPTGRQRCDHDTREDAERHHWTYELDELRIAPVDLDLIRDRHRCSVPDCTEWETHRAHGAWSLDFLCDRHANRAGLESIHPFAPGSRVIHS